ncbi:MAG: DUF2971 domain-containing protein [Treponema sp.]|nr:DUF2971 domain-containing protein [Treponema sp.]
MEKKEILNILIDNNISDNAFSYHFTSLESGIKILFEQRLKFGNITKMNDPMEFVSPSIFFETIKGLLSGEERKKIEKQLFSANMRKKTSVHIISLTHIENFLPQGNNLNKGWALSRMWAQYARNCSGCCLIFYHNKLLDSLNSQYENDILLHEPIEYNDDITSFVESANLKITTDNKNNDFSNFYLDDEKKRKLLFRKTKDFENEHEYRILLIKDTTNDDSQSRELFLDVKDSIVGIILGSRVPECFYDALSKLFKEENKIPFIYLQDWSLMKPILR